MRGVQVRDFHRGRGVAGAGGRKPARRLRQVCESWIWLTFGNRKCLLSTNKELGRDSQGVPFLSNMTIEVEPLGNPIRYDAPLLSK